MNKNVERRFDPKLKGKHFKVFATNKVFEATGYYVKPDGHRRILINRIYTIYGKPNPDYVLDKSMKETNEPLTILPNMPEEKIKQIKKAEDTISIVDLKGPTSIAVAALIRKVKATEKLEPDFRSVTQKDVASHAVHKIFSRLKWRNKCQIYM